METVKVTSGHIIHDNNRYNVGDVLQVSKERANIWKRIGVAVVVSVEEPIVTESNESVDEVYTEEQASVEEPVVTENPFANKKKKKRNR